MSLEVQEPIWRPVAFFILFLKSIVAYTISLPSFCSAMSVGALQSRRLLSGFREAAVLMASVKDMPLLKTSSAFF